MIRAALRTLSPMAWAVVAILVLALALLGTCQAMKAGRQAADRSQAGETLAEGRTAAAGDASVIRDKADDRQAETDTIVATAEEEIRNAPDRSAAADATRRRVCQLSDYRDPQCAVFRPDPRRVD